MKNRITKLLALLMVVAIVFSLAACGKEEEDKTTAAGTTVAGETTTVEETTVEGETTTMEEATTADGETTAASDTTAAPVNTVPSTKAEILTAYTTVMNKAKTDKPGYTKYEYQALPEDKINITKGGNVVSFLLNLAGDFMTTEEKAKKEPGVNAKGGNMNGFPVKDAPKGCMITNVSAIKTAKCDVLANGNYKLTLVLNDEMNPEHYQSGTTAPSNTGGMFTPLSKSDIEPELNKGAVKLAIGNAAFSLKYYNCISILTYNPVTNQVVSLDQTTYTLINMSGRIKPLFTDAEGSAVLEMNYKFFDLKY